MWQTISKFNWQKDHDIDRVSKMVQKLDSTFANNLSNFVFELTEDLMKKYQNLDLKISDSNFWNLMAEVVGRGKDFYETVNANVLQSMVDENYIGENFEYVFESVD